MALTIIFKSPTIYGSLGETMVTYDDETIQEPQQSTYLMTFIISFGLLIVTMFAYPLW